MVLVVVDLQKDVWTKCRITNLLGVDLNQQIVKKDKVIRHDHALDLSKYP